MGSARARPPSGKEGEKEKMIKLNYKFFNIFQKCLYTRLIDNRQFESKVISPAVLIECFQGNLLVNFVLKISPAAVRETFYKSCTPNAESGAMRWKMLPPQQSFGEKRKTVIKIEFTCVPFSHADADCKISSVFQSHLFQLITASTHPAKQGPR